MYADVGGMEEPGTGAAGAEGSVSGACGSSGASSMSQGPREKGTGPTRSTPIVRADPSCVTGMAGRLAGHQEDYRPERDRRSSENQRRTPESPPPMTTPGTLTGATVRHGMPGKIVNGWLESTWVPPEEPPEEGSTHIAPLKICRPASKGADPPNAATGPVRFQ